MRIACESTPIYKIKLPQERPLITKQWNLDLTTKLSDSSQSSTTEELSLSSSSDSLQKYYDTIPDSSPLRSESEAEADKDTKSPVGIIITTPKKILNSSPKRRRCKRVQFGDAQIISTHKPASEMTDDDLSRIHCRAKDYEYFRGTAQFIAAEIRNGVIHERQQQPHITTKVQSSSQSYHEVMTKTYQMCAILSTEAYVGLTCSSDHPNKDTSKNSSRCHHQNYHCAIHLRDPHRSLLEENNSEQRENGKEKIVYSEGLDSHDIDFVNQTCLTPHLFGALTHWIKLGHSRRGLEKSSVPYLVEARSLSRQAAKNAILFAQEMLNNLSNCSDEKKEKERMKSHKGKAGHCGLHHVWGPWQSVRCFSSEKHKSKVVHGDMKENHCRIAILERLGIPRDVIPLSLSNVEVLRIVSEKYTRTAKLFAVAMGHADAVALGLYCDNSNNT